MILSVCLRVLAIALLSAVCVPAGALAQNTLVPAGVVRYAPSIFPDRIVLTWTGDPATTQAVSWRTDSSVVLAGAEITEAHATPGLHLTARQVQARTTPLQRENGLAHHHQAEFTGLRPNTLYAYRVQGGGTWSEWFHFRTAEATQLYQLIHVDADRLRYEAFTVAGALYDAFELVRLGNDGNGLVDRGVEGGPLRRCGRPEIPGYRVDRCWEGTDFIRNR